jgi:hypothetical protein
MYIDLYCLIHWLIHEHVWHEQFCLNCLQTEKHIAQKANFASIIYTNLILTRLCLITHYNEPPPTFSTESLPAANHFCCTDRHYGGSAATWRPISQLQRNIWRPRFETYETAKFKYHIKSAGIQPKIESVCKNYICYKLDSSRENNLILNQYDSNLNRIILTRL